MPRDGLVGSIRFDGSNPCQAVRSGPAMAILGPVITVELERVEVLELLGMTLAHLNLAEARAEMSPRVPMLMAIRDKLARSLQEGS